jgi:hypothetical protein
MNFDVVLGNPPYQDTTNKAKNNKLWYKFIDLATRLVEPDGYIAFVNPVSLVSNVGKPVKIMKHLTSDFSLKLACIHNEKYFSGMSIDTMHWVARYAPYDNDTILIKDGKEHKIDASNADVILSIINPNHKTASSITKKVVDGSDSRLMLISENDVDKDTSGKYEYYYSGKNKRTTNVKLKGGDKLKLVLSFSASYKGMFTTTDPTAGFNRVVYVKDEVEAEQIKSFCLSKLFIFVANNYNKTSGFTPFVKNNKIPDLRRKEVWTDRELYEHFKLTQQEIDLIENVE